MNDPEVPALSRASERFHIAEWYGRPFLDLTDEERVEFANYKVGTRPHWGHGPYELFSRRFSSSSAFIWLIIDASITQQVMLTSPRGHTTVF